MRVAFLANQFLDPRSPGSWSGLPYFIRRALESAGVDTHLVVCGESARLRCWARFFYWRLRHGKRYLRHCNRALLQGYGRQIARALAGGPPVDAVFSVSTWLLAHVKGGTPAVLYTDACFAALLGFYESFSNLAPASLVEGHAVEQLALDRCARIVYSSRWAARAAQEYYDVDPARLAVVAYGAGFHEPPDPDAMADAIRRRRPTPRCHLLLVGVDWVRKGAGIAVQAAERLHALGCDVHLTVVGCKPPGGRPLPPYVEVIPFIDKGSAEGRLRLNALYERSHFFILPSRAEATPVVFSEAAAYGLPSLAADVGGISSVILNDVNGRLFSAAAEGRAYGDYIFSLIRNPGHYRSLCARALRESVTRLSWNVAGPRLAEILEECVRPGARTPPAEQVNLKA